MKELGTFASIIRTVLPVCAAWGLAGCGGTVDADDPPIARAFDQQLHWSDLRQVVPMDIAPEDSAAMAQAYVNNWLYQQVELHHAELNLVASQKQFETELRDYRNSLLLFAYEQAIVRQKLDTVIGNAEIETYYTDHSANFELREDILKARWFRLDDEEKRSLKKIEARFLGGKAEDMREIEIMLAQRSITITDRSNVWKSLTEMRNEVPIEALPSIGVNGHRITVHNGNTTWFVDILELRAHQTVSPIELVRQDIRTILLNQRKLQLIERMREDLYREALATKDIETL